jgi:hypothetical protein
MTTTVLVRDVKTGRIHKRFREDGVRGLFSHEAEAPDTSGAYAVMTQAEVEIAERDDFCRRCWPEAGTPR